MTVDALPSSPYYIRRAARGFGEVGDPIEFLLFYSLQCGRL
jgi:hypothetical protein